MQNYFKIFADGDLFISRLKNRNIKYLLWPEKTWSDKNIDINNYSKYLNKPGKCRHSNTGEMILFEVMH